MKSLSERRAADHVTPELRPARVAGWWQEIERRDRGVGARPRARRAWIASFALAIAVLGGGAFLSVRGRSTGANEANVANLATTGDVIVTRAGSSLTLPDGSGLTLGAATRLTVAEVSAAGIRLNLEEGSVTCDVVHQVGRTFEVQAAGEIVRVRGTRFTVTLARRGAEASSARVVGVRVERGRVEVAHASGPAVASLGAGQSWEETSPDTAEAPTLDETRAEAPTLVEATPRHTMAVFGSPAELFKHASDARLSGRATDAARAYETFRKRFPNDPRAGLAAFEAARIDLDALANPASALDALRFAGAHGHGAVVPEDVAALTVDALSALGRATECGHARDRFIARFPRSPHVRRVTAACGP